jgi:hypothetical protein
MRYNLILTRTQAQQLKARRERIHCQEVKQPKEGEKKGPAKEVFPPKQRA